ncbi:MAG: hypothetical protein MI892_25975 [Desulfobacterales bacterium]|nr:hypothetical protein [Desulfobacterales bacterium]
MKKSTIEFIQAQLNEMGIDAGPEDGILGPKTTAALDQITQIPSGWPKTRKAVAFIQILAEKNNIETGEVDGYWGPQTEYAFEVLQTVLIQKEEELIWRPEEIEDQNPNDWPSQTPDSSLLNYYGPVGKNQARIHLPYPHKLAWKTTQTVNSYLCHEKVHDSLLRVLSRVLDHYGHDDIKKLRLDLWGGCLNVRKKRGGNSYSLHSWGIAVDYDPSHNKLKWGRDRAHFANREYDTWWRLWEEEGWLSLGRTRNFDWMHIQAAKL